MAKEMKPEPRPMNIKCLYNDKENLISLEFHDERGPVFKLSTHPPEMRQILDKLYDYLLEIDLDK